MSKQKRQRRTRSQTLLWLLSMVIVGSMVLSLVLVALPSRPVPTPIPLPTFTPEPLPTLSPTPWPTPSPTELPPAPSPSPSPTLPATEPPVGPVLPTHTPTITPTLAITPAHTSTPAGADLEFNFAVCGDSRDNPSTYRQVLEAIMRDGSEFLLHTGDLVNKGTESQWQAFQELMASFTLPFYPVPGNHDALAGRLEGYLRYSGAQATHYSFDRGLVHFTLADSHNGGISADELAWLRDDLGTTSQPVKMVFLHHPPFDPDGTDHIMVFGNEQFMALMTGQGVDYVFAGHIHAYGQEERDGVVYTITGGAGAPLYREGHPQAFHHYLRVAVRGDEVTIEVVEV